MPTETTRKPEWLDSPEYWVCYPVAGFPDDDGLPKRFPGVGLEGNFTPRQLREIADWIESEENARQN